MQVLDGHQSAVYALAFSPDGGRLASGDRSGRVLLWDGGEPQLVPLVHPGHLASVNALFCGPPGGAIIAATSEGWVMRWPGEPESVPISVPPGATGLALVGRKLLAVGHGDRSKEAGGTLSVVDLSAGMTLYPPYASVKKAKEFAAPRGVRCVAAVGERVAWCEWGRVAYVWDIRKPDRVKLPLPAEAPCLALSPDGNTVAVGLDSYKLKLFDVARKQERRELAGHTGRVTGVAFTPDGGTVVSGSWDGTVRLWDADAGTLRQTFRWPVGKQVTSLAVSPDGLRLAVGGDTGAVVLADLD